MDFAEEGTECEVVAIEKNTQLGAVPVYKWEALWTVSDTAAVDSWQFGWNMSTWEETRNCHIWKK